MPAFPSMAGGGANHSLGWGYSGRCGRSHEIGWMASEAADQTGQFVVKLVAAGLAR